MYQEDSILLSSMSPTLKQSKKTYKKKGPSVLCLKKHFRKSLLFDELEATPKNEDVKAVDSNLLNEADASSSASSTEANMSIIYISSSSCDEEEYCEYSSPKRNLTKPNEKRQNGSNKMTSQVGEINLEKVQATTLDKTTNMTIFNEISAIYPENNLFVQHTPTNSTFVSPKSKKFNALLSSHREKPLSSSSDSEKEKCNMGNITIEDSLLQEDSSLNVEIDKSKNYKNNSDTSMKVGSIKDEDFNNEDDFSSPVKNLNESINKEDQIIFENILDKVYGKSWRKRQKEVFTPKTTQTQKHVRSTVEAKSYESKSPLSPLFPQNRHTKMNTNRTECNDLFEKSSDESCKSPFLYGNPYTERERSKSNKVLRKLETERVNRALNASWRRRLNNICDSDSEPDELENINKKLSYDYDDDDIHSQPKKHLNKVSKAQIEPDKENEYIPLEERIRRKIDNNKKTSDNIKNKRNKPLKATVKTDLSNGSSDESDGQQKLRIDKPKPKAFINHAMDSDTSEEKVHLKKKQFAFDGRRAPKSYSFLESLSAHVPIDKCDMSARIFRNNYKKFKEDLCAKLFKMYNENIFDNAIPNDTPFEWNSRMRNTAGYCYCRKTTVVKTGEVKRTIRICLSTKVLDSANRLRDTLIHELCHAAAFIIDNVNCGHGAEWKAWTHKAMRVYPELIPITTRHDYEINTKYTYRCVNCKYSIGRHSKSLNIKRKRCGYCYGEFEVFLNKVTKSGEAKSVPVTPKQEPSGFAKFVKENYATHKTPQNTHGDVMRLLGQKFSSLKVTRSKNELL